MKQHRSQTAICQALKLILKDREVEYVPGTVLTDPKTFSNKTMLAIMSSLAEVGAAGAGAGAAAGANGQGSKTEENPEKQGGAEALDEEDFYPDGSHGLSLHERGYDTSKSGYESREDRSGWSEEREDVSATAAAHDNARHVAPGGGRHAVTTQRTAPVPIPPSPQGASFTAHVLASILAKEVAKLYLTRASILEELLAWDRAKVEYQAILSVLFLEERFFPNAGGGKNAAEAGRTDSKDTLKSVALARMQGCEGKKGAGPAGMRMQGVMYPVAASTTHQKPAQIPGTGEAVDPGDIAGGSCLSDPDEPAFAPGKRGENKLLHEEQSGTTMKVHAHHDKPPGEVDKRIPVSILTGFLGAGKTTLLNKILREAGRDSSGEMWSGRGDASGKNKGKRFAVIENEFGEVGIDDDLIYRREILGEEQIIEMNNGCICCTVRGDLIKGLKKLIGRKNLIDGILIETTGLADPAPVAQTFFIDEEIQREYRLDCRRREVSSWNFHHYMSWRLPAAVESV